MRTWWTGCWTLTCPPEWTSLTCSSTGGSSRKLTLTTTAGHRWCLIWVSYISYYYYYYYYEGICRPLLLCSFCQVWLHFQNRMKSTRPSTCLTCRTRNVTRWLVHPWNNDDNSFIIISSAFITATYIRLCHILCYFKCCKRVNCLTVSWWLVSS